MAKFGVSLSDVQEAKARLAQYLDDTPVFQRNEFNEKYGRHFYFKAESMQPTGSFKIRGALNATLRALDQNPALKGLVAHSSGNHGRALSWISKTLGLQCVVVCPTTVPQSKLADILESGAELVSCTPSPVDRLETTLKIAKERQFKYISTCDDYDVIAGQGSISAEFLRQVPDLDAILIPVSGGGMAAGNCIAAKALKPAIKIFAVEPEGKGLEQCLRAGKRLWPNPPRTIDTIADGMRIEQLGQKTWPIILELAEKTVITVSDKEIVNATKLAFKQLKLVVEVSAGAAVAAAMSQKVRDLDPSLEHVGVILGGGNLDLERMPWTEESRCQE